MDSITEVILNSETHAEAHEKLCHDFEALRHLRERIYRVKTSYRYATTEDAFQHLKSYWKERQQRVALQPFQGVRRKVASSFMQKQQAWTQPQPAAVPLTKEQEHLIQEHHEAIEKETLAELRKRLRGK